MRAFRPPIHPFRTRATTSISIINHTSTNSRIQKRRIATTSSTRYQHVLYFGNVLGYNSIDRLSKFPRAWLDSVGVSDDVDYGLKWGSVSGSPSHALMSYTLLDEPIDAKLRTPRITTEDVVVAGGSSSTTRNQHYEEEGDGEGEGIVLEDEDAGNGRVGKSSQPSKVFALGRNTHAQLGLGFSSQEATRGMVTGQMTGKGGVVKVVAGSGFSFVVTSNTTLSTTTTTTSLDRADPQEQEKNTLYGFGNDTLGQLGSSSIPTSASATTTSSSADPYDISTRLPDSDAPQLRLLPLPRSIVLTPEHDRLSHGQESEQNSEWKIKDLAAGIDHSVALIERELNGYTIQHVVSTGLNTDGQLGLTPPEKAIDVPMLPLLSRTFQTVPHLSSTSEPAKEEKGRSPDDARLESMVCGADTSYALSTAGDMWVWGNSEYGQTFAGIQDRIASPTYVPNPLPAAYTAHGLTVSDAGDVKPPQIRKLVAGGSFAAILDTNGRVWMVGFGPHTPSPSSAPSAAKDWDQMTLITAFESLRPNVVVEDLFCGLEYLVAITRSTPATRSKQEADDKIEVWMWGVPPRSISTLPILQPTRIPYSLPKTPKQQWLDENPRRKNQSHHSHSQSPTGSEGRTEHNKEEEEEVEKRGKVRVEGAACTRDHLLLVLNDGLGRAQQHVWAECVQPPREKGTDVAM